MKWEVSYSLAQELYALKEDYGRKSDRIPIWLLNDVMGNDKYPVLSRQCFSSNESTMKDTQLKLLSFMIDELSLSVKEYDYASYWIYTPLDSVLSTAQDGTYIISPVKNRKMDIQHGGLKVTKETLINMVGDDVIPQYRRMSLDEEQDRLKENVLPF